MGDAVERAELVQHGAEEIIEGHIQRAEAETGQVRVAQVGADLDVEFVRRPAGVQHCHGVAGVHPAGHAGARDEREHGGVVAHGPGPEGLPQVSVQIQNVPPSFVEVFAPPLSGGVSSAKSGAES